MNKQNRRMAGNGLWVALVASVALAGCGGGGSLPGGVRLGETSSLAGTGEGGSADGPIATARFNNPVNVATSAANDVFVCDYDNHRIRRISNGNVDTVVNQPNFRLPFGIAFMPDGRLMVTTDANDSGAETDNSGTLWSVNVATRTATVVARNLGKPRGIVALNNTQLVLCDLTQNDVRLINVNTAVITPLAGSRGNVGFVNGTGDAARFNRPYGPAITPEGNILLADQGNQVLRLVTPAGVVTTFAGTGVQGYREGAIDQAQFNGPQDVDIDSSGFIYVSDNFNNRIRRIRNGQVEIIAGDGALGFAEGAGSQARFYGLEGIALSPDGTRLIVADGNGGSGNPFNRVRIVRVR